jgi:hypothetical protein
MQRLAGHTDSIDAQPVTLLRGDVVLQQALIRVLPFAQRHTAGALCFAPQEAPKIDGRTREELMDSFECVVAGGLDRNRLSWLWVEYRVRTQIRLVWVVATVDLKTNRRFVPYFDRVDRPLFIAWQKHENLSRGLQNPQAAGNRRIVSYNQRLPQETKGWAAALAKCLVDKWASGALKNRGDVIRYLEDDMFQEITSAGRDSIIVHVQVRERKTEYHLRGAIFREDYTYTTDPQTPIDISAARLQLEGLRSLREQLFAKRFRLRPPVDEGEELLCTASDPEATETDEEPVSPLVPVIQGNHSHYHDYMRGNRDSWRSR